MSSCVEVYEIFCEVSSWLDCCDCRFVTRMKYGEFLPHTLLNLCRCMRWIMKKVMKHSVLLIWEMNQLEIYMWVEKKSKSRGKQRDLECNNRYVKMSEGERPGNIS